ncbi:GlcG/HbpS family heme-binding protein [Burkholderia sp. A9]|uniref:GlcG/HbpS family heme-binding protein n=1 Tax=Burkholderia sp. A9 TaxID=1365108 RepID=UPI001F2EE520|nr:heme-binding protein [Burkholderia sp. A9]
MTMVTAGGERVPVGGTRVRRALHALSSTPASRRHVPNKLYVFRIAIVLVRSFKLILLSATMAVAAGAQAQSSAPPNVPENLPYSTPYGAPITLAQARRAIDAAEAEARRRNWQYAVAVVDSGGNLVSCDKMDDTQLASLQIAEAKAQASVRFRRATKAMQDAVNGGSPGTLSIPGILAGEGGVPIIVGGKLIGAIGTSGGAGVQDSVIAAAGAAAIK